MQAVSITPQLTVSRISLGCWPLAGMVGDRPLTPEEANRIIGRALDAGITHFDTAFCYGEHGESEAALSRVLAGRTGISIATKGGVAWHNGQQVRTGSRSALRQQCEQSLLRLRREVIDLYYLHAPDPAVPLSESASAICELIDEGKIKAAAASNLSHEQLAEFHAVCPLAAIQGQHNLLQREAERSLIPWCRQNRVAWLSYRPLMTGLLSGKRTRDDRFTETDLRSRMPLWRGAGWDRLHELLDQLRELARSSDWTLPQLVIAWVLSRPGVTSVLCGASRPEQIEEAAIAASIPSDHPLLEQMTALFADVDLTA